jgi:hypothetical protein
MVSHWCVCGGGGVSISNVPTYFAFFLFLITLHTHTHTHTHTGVPTYVRGTYAGRGYFEGAIDPDVTMQFLVNWFESTDADANTGAAQLTYTGGYPFTGLDITSVGGKYWNTDTSVDFAASIGDWGSENGEFYANDDTTAGSDKMLPVCMYPGIQYVTGVDTTGGAAGSSGQGINSLCRYTIPYTYVLNPHTHIYKYTHNTH